MRIRMIFDHLANGIQKHAKAIIVLWVVVLVAMSFFALKSGEVMHYDMNDMAPEDSESINGYKIIAMEFPAASVDELSVPIIVIYFENTDEMREAVSFVQSMNLAALTDDHIKGITSLEPMSKEKGDGILMAFILLENVDDPVAYTPDIREFIDSVKESSGLYVEEYLTGMTAISYDMERNSMEDISKIDPFTVLMILVLVGLFFRSFVSSATPPMTIGFAFVVAMGLIYFIGHILNIFYITNMMILVSMMGAGCDYCIFIIARYREELRSGRTHDDAVHQAIVWAGESITISGASVIIGFGAISVCDYSMISTMGICLALGILVALIAALTLIPSLLQVVGDRIFWPTRLDAYNEGGKATKGWYAWCAKIGAAYFEASSHFSLKHAKAIAIAAILVTVPAVYLMSESEESYDMISAMLSGESGDGMTYIGEYADQGMVMPNYSIIEYKDPIATITYSGEDGQNILHWTDYWYNDVSPTLPSLYQNMMDEESKNIAYVEGPFVWDDMVAQVYAAGITDFNEQVEYVKDHLSSTAAMYFNVLILTLSIKMENPEIIFTGVGPVIDAYVQPYDPSFSWDASVAAVKSMGITDPTMIVDTIVAQAPSLQPLIDGLREKGLSDDIMVNGFGPTIDYVMNVNGSAVGGDYVLTGSGDATYIRITSATTAPAMSIISMDSIQHIDSVVKGYVADNSGIVVEKWDTGSAVVMYEVSETVKEQFTMIEILVVVLIILLLFVVMRSYLIPIRSVLTILMSISWTLAMTHIVFTVILGEDVLWMIPIILLVICLGLGMDYDILLTTRIKENVMALGMSNDDAIHHAVTHTGSVITICGLIMGGAFGTLMLSSIPLLQEFGFALCFAILVDALIVRTYIVPAIMHLLGDWNWKGPGVKRNIQKEQ